MNNTVCLTLAAALLTVAQVALAHDSAEHVREAAVAKQPTENKGGDMKGMKMDMPSDSTKKLDAPKEH